MGQQQPRSVQPKVPAEFARSGAAPTLKVLLEGQADVNVKAPARKEALVMYIGCILPFAEVNMLILSFLI